MNTIMAQIKARRAVIEFSPEVKVDCYELPDGEFRIGLTSAAMSVGFSESWLRVTTSSPKRLKPLLDIGFTALQVPVEIAGRGVNTRGSSSSQTISLDDFTRLILFAAIKGKKEAIALQLPITKVGLTDWARLSFGYDQLTLEEKRALFYNEYAKTIDWLEEDRQDARDCILPADYLYMNLEGIF